MSTTRTPDSAALEPRSVVHVGFAFDLPDRIVSVMTNRERPSRTAWTPMPALLRLNGGGMIDR